MRFKIVIIFIACNTTYLCYGQSKHYITPGNTIYITKYDSNPPPLNFRSFGVKDGLPRGPVTAFVQSDDGYVWFMQSLVFQKNNPISYKPTHRRVACSCGGFCSKAITNNT